MDFSVFGASGFLAPLKSMFFLVHFHCQNLLTFLGSILSDFLGHFPMMFLDIFRGRFFNDFCCTVDFAFLHVVFSR